MVCFAFPAEPTHISQYFHTKTNLGRGYDFEIGCLQGRLKGDVLASGLGRDKMLEAVAKYAGLSKIVTPAIMTQIMKDPKYLKILHKQLTFAERIYIGLPYLPLPSNSVAFSPFLKVCEFLSAINEKFSASFSPVKKPIGPDTNGIFRCNYAYCKKLLLSAPELIKYERNSLFVVSEDTIKKPTLSRRWTWPIYHSRSNNYSE